MTPGPTAGGTANRKTGYQSYIGRVRETRQVKAAQGPGTGGGLTRRGIWKDTLTWATV